eukprot:364798-Chlamydomonas_euryale.AAC.27
MGKGRESKVGKGRAASMRILLDSGGGVAGEAPCQGGPLSRRPLVKEGVRGAWAVGYMQYGADGRRECDAYCMELTNGGNVVHTAWS